MLYQLLLRLGETQGEPVVLSHPVVRSFLAAATALLVSLALGDPLIAWLKRMQIHERTEKTPIEHALRGVTSWQKNDQSALCGPKFCPAWAQCKGTLIGPEW